MTIEEADKLYPDWKDLTQWRPVYKTKPLNWKSEATNKEYDYHDFSNHGYGGIHRGQKDLPNEYPYTLVYEDKHIPLWLENTLKNS